jgi:hypothetical protein
MLPVQNTELDSLAYVALLMSDLEKLAAHDVELDRLVG